MSNTVDSMGGQMAPHAVTTIEELRELVEVVKDVGAFSFDVETRGMVERHSDVMAWIEQEFKDHLATLKTTSEEIIKRSKDIIIAKWANTLALDPMRNEVFWIGIATKGRSWAIPMGHPNGEIIVPEERGDGSTVPPPGYRKLLANGKESMAKARYHIPAVFSDAPEQLSRTDVFRELEELFFDDSLVKVGHNVKFDARSLRKYYDDRLPSGPFVDTMIAQHVLNENLPEYSLDKLISRNFDGFNPYHRDGKLGGVITQVPFSKAAHYVHLDAKWTWHLYINLWTKIKNKEELLHCLRQDMDVIRVLMDMEDTGIPVDHRSMVKLGAELDRHLNELLLSMMDYAPPGFNPDSPKHKQQLLFGKKREGGLGLKPTKYTEKGSASVDEEALRNIENKHPIVPVLLDWAETKKVKSTYVDGLLTKLNKGSLHPSFHLHRTATGRLSSSNPNLQNIPRDSSVRGLFVAPPGYVLLVADYDQIELRVMCMFSGDKKMSEFFLTGEDIHSGAAALVLNKPVAEVTAEERQLGKGVNFLTAYGGGPQKLARTTGVDEEHAKYVIDQYYKQFSGITSWKKLVIEEGVKTGYVKTISGRRRRLPDLRSDDYSLRSRAERQAVNAVVQGSAADICKEAMVESFEVFKGTEAKLLVQVHDELVVMVPEDMEEQGQHMLISAMGDGKIINGIPLKVSCHSAYNWSEAKGK